MFVSGFLVQLFDSLLASSEALFFLSITLASSFKTNLFSSREDNDTYRLLKLLPCF